MHNAHPFKRGEETQTLLHNSRAAAPFHSPTGAAWLSIPDGPCGQTAIPVRSRQAQLWISANFFAEYECAPSPGALRRAVHMFEARALYHGPERPVGRRLTTSGHKIVLDLANEDNQTVEIGAQGWATTDDLTCSFQHDPQTAALPEPQTADTNPLEDLRNLLGITNETHWTRILIWLLAAMRPIGPYPILVIDGAPGTGKSTLARCLKSVLDPGPEGAGRIRIFDVNSRPRKSAAEIAETAPVIWIGKAARLSERVEIRSVWVTLEHHEHDRTSASMERDLAILIPAVLGSICTAVSQAMANWKETSEGRYPRLADATAWATGAAPALGRTPQEIVAAISRQSVAAASAASNRTTAQAAAQGAPQTTAQAAPQTTAQAAPQTTAQAAPQTTAQAAPQTTAQAARQTTAQAAPQTAQAAPQTTAQAAPQTTAQAAPQTTAQAARQTTAQAARQTTAQAAPQTTAQAAPQTTAQAAPQTTAQAARQTTAQAARQTTAQAAPQTTAQTVPQTTGRTAPQTTPQAALALPSRECQRA